MPHPLRALGLGLGVLGLAACGAPAPAEWSVVQPTDPYLLKPQAVQAWELSPPEYAQGPGSSNPILQVLAPAVSEVIPGRPIALSVTASHPKGLPLAYAWAATGGVLSADAGLSVQWTPPEAKGTYVVTVVVTDPEGGLATGRLNLMVRGPQGELPTPAPAASNLATQAGPQVASPRPSPTPTPEAELARIEGVVTALPLRYLAGAEVKLLRADGEQRPFEAQNSSSDASGRFRFEGLPPGRRFKVVVRAAGLRERSMEVMTTRGATSRADFWGVFGLLPE